MASVLLDRLDGKNADFDTQSSFWKLDAMLAADQSAADRAGEDEAVY
jgi:hypothetical protein